jgi:ABC-2 type transport system permease protein
MKALQIAIKDTLTRFRDWKALAGMLAAPLVISGLIGLAFGNLSAGETPIENIPVAIVNHDDGQLGQAYADVLGGEDLDDLIDLRTIDDLDAAKAGIENGELRAVLYIPAGFSEQIVPAANSTSGPGSGGVQLFTDPTSEISPLIIESIVSRVTSSLNTVLLAGDVSAGSLIPYAQLVGPQMANIGNVIADELDPDNFDFSEGRLQLHTVQTGEGEPFDPFAFFIPGMAVFFLMFSMFEGSRSIILEETRGTLPRLMTTPTPSWQIILGKMGGTFLSGLLQFTVLVVASSFIFGVNWGRSPVGLALIVVLTVFAASGLGALLTVFARNENQAGVIGGAVSLIFGALGGSFFPAQSLTGIVNFLSKLTINRWAMDGLTTLAVSGGDLYDVRIQALVLALIGAVTFGLAIWAFQRRFVK